MGRVPGSIQDTPQIINVVPQEILEQKNAQTLQQVLRGVPGITLATGEGGPPNGDQFRIRGIQAKADQYTDGLRDFGIYTRDSFNYESVQVLKGPSSSIFGSGTGGGAVNVQSKLPFLANSTDVDFSGGSGPLYRTTIDTNRKINEIAAIRVNAMYHNEDKVDRDLVGSERWGLATALGFGLGTDTEWTLSYLHQEDNRVTDYGIPLLAVGGRYNKPGSENGIPRSTFYGFTSDRDDTRHDSVTSKFKREINDHLTLYNDTRYAWYERFFMATQAGGCTSAACVTAFFDGNPATIPSVNRGGPGPYDLEGWGFQNLTTLLARFNTSRLRHEVTTGVDYVAEHTKRQGFSYTPGRPPADYSNPSPAVNFTWAPSNSLRESDSDTVGLFINDRVWFNDYWSVLGGVRWDNHSVRTVNNGAITSVDSDLVNPKASLIWEPTELQTYYFSWSRAGSPQGSYIVGDDFANATTAVLDPEITETFELGGKVSLRGGRLGLSGAIFQVDKDNAVQVDPVTGTIVADGTRGREQKQRVRGFEVGLTGELTDRWTVFAGYTYLDAEIRDAYTTAGGVSTPAPQLIGNTVPIVPAHSASMWMTYDITSFVLPRVHDYELLVGTGVTYNSEIFLNNDNTAVVPDSFVWDAMLSYQPKDKGWKAALNVYNITDELYYDSLWTSRAVPASGRAVIASVGRRF
ncbi:MAG: TonB-dependent receptor [Hyphomicrobiales bacterium]